MEKLCQKHWQVLGINTPDDLKQYIEGIFEKHSHQHDVMIALYKMVFPNWDQIKKVHGWPEVGDRFWKFVCNRFQDFDRMFHPDVMCAGAWMNWGFSVNEKLDDWEISFKNCSIERR